MSDRSCPAPDRPLTAANGAKLESLIGWLLLAGVLLSMTLIAAGVVWNFIATGTLQLIYSITGANLGAFLAAEFRELHRGDGGPRLLVNLGLAVLLLTPYLRVLASLTYFAAAERNWKYTAFTAAVFAILTYSLFLR